MAGMAYRQSYAGVAGILNKAGQCCVLLLNLLIHRAFSVLTNRRADMMPVISNQRRIFL